MSLGAWGETVARWFLERRGLRVDATNVRAGQGEIDLIARDGAERIAVEVRTRHGDIDEVTAVDQSKLVRMAYAARLVGADRMDLVVIGIGDRGVQIRWVPGVSG